MRLAGRDDSFPELGWIPGFWQALAPYAYAREEDEVLILPPNLVYKTNQTGLRLIRYLEGGGALAELPGLNRERADQIQRFFLDIKAAHEGRNPVLEQVLYDFDFTRLPVLGEIAVTYRCNNRCRFCYADCSPRNDSPELDTAGFRRVIDLFRDEAKIPFFSFTGGEPLLRADLEDLIAHALSRNLRVNLVSNGTLASAERARSLYAAGLRTAQISLEAPAAGLHDELCGRAGSFDETVEGIHNLMAAGIRVQTNSTLTAMNREALLGLPAFVRSLGLERMAMNLFIPAGSGLRETSLQVPYREVARFVPLAQAAARKAGLEFFWYSPTPLCLFNPIAAGLGNKSCAACDGLLSVSPEGAVLPCSSWPEPVGKPLESGFRSVWFGERADWIKHKHFAPPACRDCSSFTACQSACPLYWKVCGYGELENSGAAAWKRQTAPKPKLNKESAL